MLPQSLGPVEIRVLGALIEKELSTPDHYPLSLNSLTSACNQSSNRDPVMALEEGAVSGAIDILRRMSLVRSFQGSGSRVPKYQHLLVEAADVSRAELAVLCVLTLRGAQTLGEVRSRAARLVADEDVGAVDVAIEALIAREPSPAVARLARRPGQKEARLAHLLGGVLGDEVQADGSPGSPGARNAENAEGTEDGGATQTNVVGGGVGGDRVAVLEEKVGELGREIADLRSEFAEFRKQFE